MNAGKNTSTIINWQIFRDLLGSIDIYLPDRAMEVNLFSARVVHNQSIIIGR